MILLLTDRRFFERLMYAYSNCWVWLWAFDLTRPSQSSSPMLFWTAYPFPNPLNKLSWRYCEPDVCATYRPNFSTACCRTNVPWFDGLNQDFSAELMWPLFCCRSDINLLTELNDMVLSSNNQVSKIWWPQKYVFRWKIFSAYYLHTSIYAVKLEWG
jgi:hypothetical protein